MNTKATVWVDADACPNLVKEVIFKAADKRQVKTVLVSNSYLRIPGSKFIEQRVVDQGQDVADFYIVKHASVGDLVVTADIPLAADLVEKKILVINPKGEVYTASNIKEVLAMRNLMAELRGGGLVEGGSAPISVKVKEQFANCFDRELTKLLKK